jgi:hypothetical protein
MARWDFVPWFHKGPLESKKWSRINARIETCATSGAYRGKEAPPSGAEQRFLRRKARRVIRRSRIGSSRLIPRSRSLPGSGIAGKACTRASLSRSPHSPSSPASRIRSSLRCMTACPRSCGPKMTSAGYSMIGKMRSKRSARIRLSLCGFSSLVRKLTTRATTIRNCSPLMHRRSASRILEPLRATRCFNGRRPLTPQLRKHLLPCRFHLGP